MLRYFHVSSSRNRASIERYGLDWRRMGPARGIAGSPTPELDGVFLCRDESDVVFFADLNPDAGPVDVWAVSGVEPSELLESPEGFAYVARTIPAGDVELVEGPRDPAKRIHPTKSSAYRSELMITLDTGEVLRGDDAHHRATRTDPSG